MMDDQLFIELAREELMDSPLNDEEILMMKDWRFGHWLILQYEIEQAKKTIIDAFANIFGGNHEED